MGMSASAGRNPGITEIKITPPAMPPTAAVSEVRKANSISVISANVLPLYPCDCQKVDTDQSSTTGVDTSIPARWTPKSNVCLVVEKENYMHLECDGRSAVGVCGLAYQPGSR